jgi:hypothetical protein
MPTRAQLRMEQALRRMERALAAFAEESDPRGPVRLQPARPAAPSGQQTISQVRVWQQLVFSSTCQQ